MTRAIIRYSLDGGNSTIATNELRRMLARRGFSKIGNEAFEADDISLEDALDGIRDALDKLQNAPGGGDLDHLTIHLDQPDRPD